MILVPWIMKAEAYYISACTVIKTNIHDCLESKEQGMMNYEGLFALKKSGNITDHQNPPPPKLPDSQHQNHKSMIQDGPAVLFHIVCWPLTFDPWTLQVPFPSSSHYTLLLLPLLLLTTTAALCPHPALYCCWYSILGNVHKCRQPVGEVH